MTFNYNKVFYHGKSALLVKVLVYIIITYKMSVLPSDIIYLVYIVPLILIDHKIAIRLWRNWSFKIHFDLFSIWTQISYNFIVISYFTQKKNLKIHPIMTSTCTCILSDMLQCSLTDMRNFSRVSWATVLS